MHRLSNYSPWLDRVARNPDLTASASRLAVLIAGLVDNATGTVAVSQTTLAKHLCLDNETIRRIALSMVRQGLLRVRPGYGRHLTIYEPIIPPDLAALTERLVRLRDKAARIEARIAAIRSAR